ncbi:MAG: hypothetical protein R3F34_10285 [Planctomycetota bacterium]
MIGAPGNPTTSDPTQIDGTAVLYLRDDSGSWYESVATRSSSIVDGQTGLSVALQPELFVVGSPYADDVGTAEGAILVHRRATFYRGRATVTPLHDEQPLLLRAGREFAGAPYLVLGSVTGTAPATPLGGVVEVPLVFDAYTQLTLMHLAPVDDAFDVLKSRGERNASFVLPPGLPAAFDGLEVHHAFVAVHPETFEVITSDPVTVRIEL